MDAAISQPQPTRPIVNRMIAHERWFGSGKAWSSFDAGALLASAVGWTSGGTKIELRRGEVRSPSVDQAGTRTKQAHVRLSSSHTGPTFMRS